MNKKHNYYCTNYYLGSYLLLKLENVEIKLDWITKQISSVRNLIAFFRFQMNALIKSIENSTKELHRQNVTYLICIRKHMNKKYYIHSIGRIGYGL